MRLARLVLALALAPLAACGPARGPAHDADTVHARFQCEDLLVPAVFDRKAGHVRLELPDGPLTLPAVDSGSGERYADGAGNEFWHKGSEATLRTRGFLRACRLAGQPLP
jgi:membrane-bound inhibitor of C-type lysozyme